MHANTIITKVFFFGASVLIGIWTLTGVAAAAPAQKADGGVGAGASPHDGRSPHVTECSPSHCSDRGRSSDHNTGTGDDIVVLSATSDSAPVDSSSVDVLGPAVSGTAGAAVADVVQAEEVVAAAGEAPVDSASAHGRPAEVLGVRYERPAPSVLARTGVDLVPLAGVGVVLCLVGVGLSSVRPRRDTISVAARLTGHDVAA